MNKLVIFGIGDIAKLAHYYFSSDSNYEVTAFTVDKQYMDGDVFLGRRSIELQQSPNDLKRGRLQ